MSPRAPRHRAAPSEASQSAPAPEEHTVARGGQAARGAAWLGVVTMLTKGSQMIVTVGLAAFLTSPELGRVAVVLAVVNLGQVLQIMGVYDVIAKTHRPPLRFTGTVATLSVGAGLLLAVMMVLGAPGLAAALGAPGAAPLIAWSGLGLPFIAYGGVQMAYMHRLLDFRRRVLPDGASALLGASLTIGLAAAGFGATSAIVGALTTMVTLPLFCLLAGVRIRPRLDRADAAEALRWAGVVGPGAVIGLVLLNVDYVVVTRVLGEAQTGLYSLAFRIASVPFFTITYVLGAVAFPFVTTFLRAGDRDGARRAMGDFLWAVAALVGGLSTVFAVLADRVVLLSPRWEGSATSLAVLCGFCLLLSLQLMTHEFLRAAGGSVWYLAGQAVHLALLLPALVVLTPAFGIVGTALAQLGAVALSLVVAVAFAARAGVLRPAQWCRAIGRAPLSWVAVGLVGLALRQVPPFDDPASWVGSILLGVVLLGLMLGVYGLLERARLLTVVSLVRRREVAPEAP